MELRILEKVFSASLSQVIHYYSTFFKPNYYHLWSHFSSFISTEKNYAYDIRSSEASHIKTPKYLKSLLIVFLTSNIATKIRITIIITSFESQSYSGSLIRETKSKEMMNDMSLERGQTGETTNIAHI